MAFRQCATNILYGICVTTISTLWQVGDQVHWDNVSVKTLNYTQVLPFIFDENLLWEKFRAEICKGMSGNAVKFYWT